MTIRVIFLVLYVQLFSCIGLTAMAIDTLSVVEIAQEQGLSQLGAATMAFDEKGYLWIGTQNGLNRFNGYGMKVYYSGDKEEDLRDDHIRSCHLAGDTLWLTTSTQGIMAYLMRQDKFIGFESYIDYKKHPNTKYAYTLHAPNEKNLVGGTVGNVIWIDRATMNSKVIPLTTIKDNDFVTSIIAIGQEHFLIGTNASGIVSFNSEHFAIVADPIFRELAEAQINCLFQRPDKAIWIGTNKGLYNYDVTKNTLHRLSALETRSLHQWDSKTILVGGLYQNYLISKDDLWEEVVFTNQLGKVLQSDILSFTEDDQGGRWIGTESRGMYYFHPHRQKFTPKRIQLANTPKQDFISTFNFLRDGDDLWMAGEFGFFKHRLGTNQYQLYQTDLLEYTLHKDHRGQIWGGGFGQGLVRYDRSKDQFEQIPLTFEDLDIIHITPVHPDSLWLHTWSTGIYAFNIHDYGVRPVSILGKPTLRSRISLTDSKGDIWIGSEEGLYQIGSGGVIFYDSLSNERVFAITEDSQGDIWVGTARGLNQINPHTKKIKHYLQQTGLPNDFIYAAEVDDHGNVWASTNYGLSVLNRKTMTFRNYTEEDGLQNNEFNGKAGYRDSLGYLYFGGMNGFNIFHPDSVFANSIVGKTWIEDVRLFGKSLPKNILYTDTLVFPHDQNVISFDFASLNFLWPTKNRYQYMLVGFDEDWRPATKELSATYTNLDPGTYIFRVRGSNNELLWGDYDEITVVIESPWYKTLWFRFAAVLTIVLLIVGFFINKTKQQKRINKRLLAMVDERTEELNVSLNLSQKQKDNISFLMEELNHRVKNNLQLITSLIDIQSFEIADQDIQGKLRILQSRVFTVSKIHDLLNQKDSGEGLSAHLFMADLARDLILFSAQDIQLDTHIDEVRFPSNRLTYIGLILNELITNSIKHAFSEEQKDKIIAIHLQKKDDTLLLVYSDNGKGCDVSIFLHTKQQGISLIQMLVKELRGTVDFTGDDGFACRIVLPII